MKMKILAAGDIHGDQTLATKLAEKSGTNEADLVILCGDLTMHEASTDNIIGQFKKMYKDVLLVPGNHETIATADFLAELYGVKNLHGTSVMVGDIGFFGVGGANIGLFQLSDEELFDALKKAYEGVKDAKKKIMVTHVHPTGTKIEKFTGLLPGSSGVRRALDMFKPDIHLCSHVHEADGIEEMVGKTKVINVGRTGKIIDI